MASSDTLHWKRNLVLMWLSQLLILSGFAAVMPFIPLFLKDQLGIVAEGERGIYMSMFYFFGVLGYAMFCPIWGPFRRASDAAPRNLCDGFHIPAHGIRHKRMDADCLALSFRRLCGDDCRRTDSDREKHAGR